ncbi:DEAD/DEAH box helicase [Alteromonas macleodii]|uniref:DEAD/DEAH box helicase n=1 Tax=Alteromonas macleodii TaxID=28108 RepID=UPI003BF8A358
MSAMNSLKRLAKNEKFQQVLNDLQNEVELSKKDQEYILSCAILFIKSYQKDERRTSHFEIAYFIVLLFYRNYKDSRPLLDVSVDFGFYPVTNFLLEKEMSSLSSFQKQNLSNRIKEFKEDGITLTLEQRKNNLKVVSSEGNQISYIAPTSFGKSSLFLKIIEKRDDRRVAIIVPTKSLLAQTYRVLNKSFPDRKVISHDEMYDGENDFIATLTQERALRLLKNKDVSFDLLIIDEAHNIFEYSSRSILLTRLIRRNRKRNINSKNYYFSPLVADSSNLLIEKAELTEYSIKFNVKEPLFFGLDEQGNSLSYNRFTDSFSMLENSQDYISYITENKKENNFVYINTPRKIENFAKLFAESREKKQSRLLEKLAEVISKNVHEDFYAVDLIQRGVIYIHGKLPDLIKEYLESKFREYSELDFLVANTVILEGVNLPIDNLFILNAYGLSSKDLVNLIGRVNRLNEVFNRESGRLEKLLVPAHFVTCEFNDPRAKILNSLKKFTSHLTKDIVKNPLLSSFDFEELRKTADSGSGASEEAQRKLSTYDDLVEKELYLVNDSTAPDEMVRKIFLESNFDRNYSDVDYVVETLTEREAIFKKDLEWNLKNPIEKIYEFFIDGLEDKMTDPAFARLRFETARNYYKGFVHNLHTLPLKEHINDVVKYFKAISKSDVRRYIFIGYSYGELSRDNNSNNKLYIDLSKKSHREQVNLALIKIKLESDFVSYKLNDHINFLKEINLISEDEYNLFIYGTSQVRNTKYTKLGLSSTLVNKLEKDQQLENIEIDELGHISVKKEFKEYIQKQDDLLRFEISKYILV